MRNNGIITLLIALALLLQSCTNQKIEIGATHEDTLRFVIEKCNHSGVAVNDKNIRKISDNILCIKTDSKDNRIFSVRSGTLYPEKYDMVYILDCERDYLLARKDAVTSVFDKNFNLVFKLDSLSLEYFEDSLFVFRKLFYINGKIGLMDFNGNIIADSIYDNIILLTEDYLSFYLHQTGGGKFRKLTYPDLSYKMFHNSGLIFVTKNRKVGIVNKNGHEVVTPVYDFLWDYLDGMLIAMKNTKWGVIDLNGKEIIPLEYDAIGDFRVQSKCDHWLWNIDFFETILMNYYSEDPLVTNNQKKYDEIKGFSENLIRVKKKGKWGLINLCGGVEAPFIFESMKNFKNGMAEVIFNGKRKFINKKGNIIIER